MGNFFLKIFPLVVYIQNEQRVMGIILRYVCSGIPPSPQGAWMCCSAAEQCTDCGDDHAPVTRGRMRAQYPLHHGPQGARRFGSMGEHLMRRGYSAV